ncbi:DUF1861 family protein [Paenibacillus sp. CMAA1364]
MKITQTCQQLLNEFVHDGERSSSKLSFLGIDGYDAYNISAPFTMDGKEVLAARVELRDSEQSQVMFFKKSSEAWSLIDGAPVLKLQDPFVTEVGSEWIIGGVRTIASEHNPEHIVSWVTEFYRGHSLFDLAHFATGPDRMKDIRLLELPNGKIAVCTRPQGEVGGKGKIGFIVLPSLAQLNEQSINAAAIYQDQFIPDEWGGVNELHLLANGMIGALGHIASFENNEIRHYYSMTFAIHPVTSERTPIKIIAIRDMFQEGPTKREDLVDVLFSGGIVRHPNEKAMLYTGVSDAEAHCIEIQDPFIVYELLPEINYHTV